MKRPLSLYSKLILVSFIFLFLNIIKISPKTCINPATRDNVIDSIKSLDEFRYSIGTIVKESTSIQEPGYYVLGDNIDGQITIASNDVSLNLNNFYVYDSSGTSSAISIENGYKNISITNGTIKGTGINTSSSSGIFIKNSVELVKVENVKLFDFENGIYVDGLSTGTVVCLNISDCTIAICNKGVVANHLTKGIFKNIDAKNCLEAGFEINYSNFNLFEKCNALNITNDDEEKGAIGFSSFAGQGNLFNECVADGIISTTSLFGNDATGFLLTGTDTQQETESKIINSLVNTIQSTGCGTPYGIHLKPFLLSGDELLQVLATDTFDSGSTDRIKSVAWSPDGKYVAVAGDAGNDSRTSILYFDGSTLTEQAVHTVSSRDANSVTWSPDGKYLVVGGSSGSVVLLSFDGNSLIEKTSYTTESGTIQSVSWSNDGKYIAMGGEKNNDWIVVTLNFDGSSLTEQAIYTFDGGNFDSIYSIDWSPNGRYLATAGTTNNGIENDWRIAVLRFDGSSLTEQSTYTFDSGDQDYLNSIAWSPSGKYIAAAGEVNNDWRITIFTFDNSSLTEKTTYTFDSGTGDAAISVAWSPDEQYLTVGGSSSNRDWRVAILHFNGLSLTEKKSYTFVTTRDEEVFSIAWSPDGKYIAAGGYREVGFNDNWKIDILSAMNPVSNCKIENNNISNCNSQVSAGGAIGINGASGINLIIKNICYECNIPFSYGIFNKYFEGLTGSPSSIINISIPPYGQTIDTDSLENKLCFLDSKVRMSYAKADLSENSLYQAHSKVDNLHTCNETVSSKIDPINDELLNIDSKIDNLLEPCPTILSKVDIVNSKILIIDSKIDNPQECCITVNSKIDEFNPENRILDIDSKIDLISECYPQVSSKIDILISKFDLFDIGTPITESTVISSPGFYFFDNVIDGSIEINSDNVYLDLKGYEIYDTSSTETLIKVSNDRNNIVIANGFIRDGSDGILIEGGTSLVQIEDIQITDCTNGINFDVDSTSTIRCCKVKNCIFALNEKGVTQAI